MSLKDAEKFLEDYQNKTSEDINNIFKNINSKFESKDAKLEYIAEKANEMGYSFNSTELMDVIKNNKNILNKDQLLNVVGASSLDNLKEEIKDKAKKAKNLWDSLF